MTTPEPSYRKNNIKLAEQLKVIALLNQVCRKEGEFAVYDDNWNDDRVAKASSEQLGRPVTKNNVYGIRVETIGKLRENGRQKTNGHAEPQAELKQELAELTQIFNANHEILMGYIQRVDARVQFLEELLDKRTEP